MAMGSPHSVLSLPSGRGVMGLACVLIEAHRDEGRLLKSSEEFMEILQVFDLTGSLRSAAGWPGAITRRWRATSRCGMPARQRCRSS